MAKRASREDPGDKPLGSTPKIPLYRILGPVGSKPHRDFISRSFEIHDFQLKQSAQYWENTIRWMRLYLAQHDRQIPQSQEDQWMADVFVPRPFFGIEGKVGTLTDILNSADPPIQPEPIGDEDFDNAKPLTKLLDYSLRKNSWTGKRCPGILRRCGIQGTEIFKVVWANQYHEFTHYPDQREKDEFQQRLAEAYNVMGITDPETIPDYEYDPEAFNVWKGLVNKDGRAKIPDIPRQGKKELCLFRGPLIQRVPLYDLVLDPLIDEMQAQNHVFHRMLKTPEFCRQKVKEGVWDGPAVEECIRAGGDIKISEYEKTVNRMLGYMGDDADPTMRDAVEVFEKWSPTADVLKYSVVLNRKGVVNKDPSRLPFVHGQIPYGAVRNIWVPGYMYGISELQEPESLFAEENIMRSLRINRTILETFPMFTRLQEFGISELKRKLQPGGFIPVMRQGAIDTLIKYQPTHAFEDLRLIGENVDETTGMGSNVRGAPAVINRVSATEDQGRRQQSLVRIKLQAVMLEDEFNQPIPQQFLGLWYQKGDFELRTKIAGSDPLAGIAREAILEALESDYRFRGATRILQRDILVQQLNMFLKDNAGTLIPPEIRSTMRILAEAMGLKGIAKMVSQAGDEFFTKTYEVQKFMLDQQHKQIEAQKMAAGIQPPPGVSPEIAQQLEAELGAAGVEGPGGASAGAGAGAGAGAEMMGGLPNAA